ncbi:MAG: hypothetical protein HY303_17710 [Candidatus Wallbacteria bacterium]|nr:hypothetical protein [Candidatus Wallbacteria bacterium]
MSDDLNTARELGSRLRTLRVRAGIDSTETLAQKLTDSGYPISSQGVLNLENGRDAAVDVFYLFGFSRAVGVSLFEVLALEGPVAGELRMRLRSRIQERFGTLGQAASKLGITPKQLDLVLKANGRLSPTALDRFADILGIPRSDLAPLDDNRPDPASSPESGETRGETAPPASPPDWARELLDEVRSLRGRLDALTRGKVKA